jgi:DNA-binding transcriptional regulator YdaS (Cro superfamily)
MTPEDALDKAISIIGSMQALADVLGVTKGAVGQWKMDGRRIPAEHCPVIERHVNREVTCEQLRPDVDWAYLRAASAPAAPAPADQLPYTIPNGEKKRESKAPLGRQPIDPKKELS